MHDGGAGAERSGERGGAGAGAVCPSGSQSFRHIGAVRLRSSARVGALRYPDPPTFVSEAWRASSCACTDFWFASNDRITRMRSTISETTLTVLLSRWFWRTRAVGVPLGVPVSRPSPSWEIEVGSRAVSRSLPRTAVPCVIVPSDADPHLSAGRA